MFSARSLTTVGVCVQQQDRAAGGRVLVPAGLTRTRLPLVSRRAAPRPPAARADVVHGGVAQPDSASACHAEGCGFEARRPRRRPTLGSVPVAQADTTRP